jgi:hypothetical protein
MPLFTRFHSRAAPGPSRVVGCPFHDGPATLDALLAEIGPGGGAALDLALELRYAFHQTRDAAACVALATRLRAALGEDHYLALYRVRHWLARTLAIEVRAHRGDEWTRLSLPFHAAPIAGGLEAACVAQWAQDRPGRHAASAQRRYVFTTAAAPVPSRLEIIPS